MRISVVAVGKVKERGLRELIDEYAKRIKRHATFDEREVRDGSEREVDARLVDVIDARDQVIVLDVPGKTMTTQMFAQMIGRAERDAKALSFVIGGAYGLTPGIRSRANSALSLSAMILPHRLARLLLTEQIYRAFTILRGEPYSH